MTPATFDRVISPVSPDSFLSEFWGKSFLRIPGQIGKFQTLLPWSELNSILEHYSLAAPSQPIHMFRDGARVDARRFSVQQNGRQRLKLASLINCLSDGATMILDQVDEMAPAVRELAKSFEEVLHTYVSVNLYASWRDQKGFDLHWDSQDIVILQLSGRKRWKVYPPTRLHPMEKDVGPAPKPVGEPLWDGILEDGDVIYLPRGWWHVAHPLNEPSLHLTVSICPANGVDFLKWFIHRLKRNAEVRKDVPCFSSDEGRKEYLAIISKLLTEAWSADLLEAFLADWESKIPLRPKIHLPFAPIEQRAPITVETLVRLATTRRLVFDDPGGSDIVGFSAGEIRGECPSDLVPAMQRLSGTASRSVGELCSHLVVDDSTQRLMILLATLAMGGVVLLERGSKPPQSTESI